MSLLSSPLMRSAENDCTAPRVCEEVAKIFGVRIAEVGLLRLEGQLLTFLFPVELRAAGAIPLSSSAIAARTAESRKPEVLNNFAQVQHHTIFESIKIGDEPNNSQTIQKLMSAPVVGADETVLGVLQISRKGATRTSAGPDFDIQDLNRLEGVASEVGRLIPSMATDVKIPRSRLTFRA